VGIEIRQAGVVEVVYEDKKERGFWVFAAGVGKGKK